MKTMEIVHQHEDGNLIKKIYIKKKKNSPCWGESPFQPKLLPEPMAETFVSTSHNCGEDRKSKAFIASY